MKNAQYLKRFSTYIFAAALAAAAPTLLADDQPNYYPGGYGGWGHGMMGGYGGYGMGPGMMGPGMMGQGMMGQGMMGQGMMGPGMMGGYWGRGLDLTDEQEAKINKIQDETRKQNWALMGAMLDQQAKLRDLYSEPKRDAAAIDEAYKFAGKLHQQMYDNMVAAQKRMEELLTKEQQEKLRKNWRRGWAGDK